MAKSCLAALVVLCTLGVTMPLDAAIVFQQASFQMTSPTSGNASTSLTIPKPAGLVEGELMLAQVTVEKGSDAAITATGWTLVVRTNSGSDIGQGVYRKFATATDAGSGVTGYGFTFSQSVKAAGSILRYAGVDATNPIVASGGSAGASGNLLAPSVNAEAGSVLVALYGLKKAGTTITPPVSMTGRVDFQNPQDVKIRVADEPRPAAGLTGSRSATPSVQEKWVAQSVTLRQGVVAPVNSAPVYTAAANQTATTSAAKAIDLGSFTDGDSAAWTVQVNWGDASVDSYPRASAGGVGTESHTYTSAGTKTVSVFVSDGINNSNTATFTVTVSDPDTASPQIEFDDTGAYAPNGSNGWWNSGTAKVKVTATDSSGVTALECTLAGTPVTLTSTAANATQRWGDVEMATDGSRQVSCGATDGAANTTPAGARATHTLSRDTVAPAVIVTGVTEGGSYLTGSDVPGCTTTDTGGSGVATNATLVSISDHSVAGPKTVICTGGVDVAGNAQAAPVSVNYTITEPDTASPQIAFDDTGTYAPNGSNGWWNSGTAKVKVTATDSSGVTALECTLAGTPVTLTNTGSDATQRWGDVEMATDGSRQVSCGATDGAANTTPAGARATHTLSRDTVAPAVIVTGVTEGGSYLTGSDVPGCTTTDTGGSGVATNATLVSISDHSVAGPKTVICTGGVDVAGNAQAAPVSVNYTITEPDVAGPVIAFDATGAYAPNGSNGWWNSGTAKVKVTATDSSGVTALECTLAGSPVTLTNTGSDATQRWGDVEMATDGSRAVMCEAADTLGNTSASATHTLNRDTVAPVVTVTGATSGGSYLIGSAVPACDTTDIGGSGVATSATLQSTPDHSTAGAKTATCAGGVDIAGIPQAAPVSVNYTITAPVVNVAPDVTITSPADGALFKLGTPISISATYTDAGTGHTCAITSDGVGVTATVTPGGGGGGSCMGTTTPSAVGVYTISVRVTDSGGLWDEDSRMVVVYDPTGGFVTGGGWINSPAGAYAADATLTGRANFGFVSKYQKGATVPTGQTEFHFHAGDFRFNSTSYDWLVVSGPKAQYKGAGTVNGVSGYSFLVTITDGQIAGGGGVDKFRIRITGPGGIVYDNVPGAGDDMRTFDPQALGGGNIVVHAK